MIIDGWRIAKPQFSLTPDAMLDGEGAYRYGGRWNSKGTRIVYLASSLSLASLEILVHLNNKEILDTFCKLQVKFDENLVETINITALPIGWQMSSMVSPLAVIGDQWVSESRSLILKVPSAVTDGEFNYLLNPQHPDYTKLEIGTILPINFDPRLK